MSRGNSGFLWEHKHSGSGETEERGQRTGKDDVGGRSRSRRQAGAWREKTRGIQGGERARARASS
jgi:hypothetical protein